MRVRRSRLQLPVPLAVFVLAFLIYFATVAPSITWQHDGYDGGDLITAAYTLGVPHPTGYPTYMLLGHLFTRVPLGNVAYRMNLFSSVCAALTVTLCYTISMTLLDNTLHAPVAALCAALWLAASRVFWSQAIITEVYALNALFFAATIGLMLTALAEAFRADGSAKRERLLGVLAPLALVYGLSLGNHLTMALCAPTLLYLCIAIGRRRALRATDWFFLGGLFLLGLSIYAYLPLRAGREPLSNWGNPRTLQGFLWVVGGGIYRQFVLSLPPMYWPQRFLAWAHLLVQQFGPVGTALGLLGMRQESRQSPQRFAFLVVITVLYSVYAALYNTTDSYVYLLPVYIVFAMWLAQGARIFIGFAARATRACSRWPTALACALLLALPLQTLAANLPSISLHNDLAAYDYGTQALAQVPDRSIILSGSDPHTFTLWYLARVVTDRPQVAVVDCDLLDYDWYVANLRQAYRWLQFPPGESSTPLTVERLVNANRPSVNIYWADADADTIREQHLQPDGLLYH